MSKKSTYYLAGSAAFITFLLYLPALRNEFVWDDYVYVTLNSRIRTLDAAFFTWAWSSAYASNWHPLTWLSHAVDYALWGLNPAGHHLTNNILHATSVFFVVLLAHGLLDAVREKTVPNGGALLSTDRSVMIAAGATGVLFGLHPAHVESAAWVAERKDLLCALFFLLSIISYTVSVRGIAPGAETEGASRRMGKHYLAALGFFILALLSKPMAVSLPVVLLILDWYPFQRMRSLRAGRAALAEKLPFFALSLISSVLTLLAQRAGGAVQTPEFSPLSVRALVAVKALAVYLGKMIAPLHLVPFYPYPRTASPQSAEYLVPMVLVVGITATCVAMAKKRKWWLSVWGCYVATLIPVLGFVQVGHQAMADRYTYLPSIGPFLVVGLGAAWGEAQSRRLAMRGAKLFVYAVPVVVIACLSFATVRQIGVWKDSMVFWNYVIRMEPDKIPQAYYNRALAFEETGQLDQAIADYDKTVSLKPSFFQAYVNQGLIFDRRGELDRALADFDRAIYFHPDDYYAYNNRGLIFLKRDQLDRAIADFDTAISLNPAYDQAYFNRATAFQKSGEFEKANRDFMAWKEHAADQ